MKKIKELSNTTWKNHQIEDLGSLTEVRGGLRKGKTKNSTYIPAPGGGRFDDGNDGRR